MAVSTVSRLFPCNSRKSRLFDTALGGRHTQTKERRKYRKYYYMFTDFLCGALLLGINPFGRNIRPEYRMEKIT
jgi:hypothetical protein